MKHAKLLAVVVGFFLAVLPASAFAVENSGVGGKPANPRDDNPRTQSIFVHEINPGETVQDEVEVINNTAEPKTVTVYATDSQTSSGGAFACEQKADTLDREGQWIKLDKETVELKPNGTEKVGFVIAVPKDASVGEHNACIAIQAIEKPVDSGTNGVQLSFRSAIRVAVTIPGEIDKQLTFENLVIIQKDNKIIVRPILYNGGNVSLDTQINTSLKTLLGIKVDSKEGQYPVLPGQSAEFNFEYSKPSYGGFFRVTSSASYNNDTAASLGETGSSNETLTASHVIFVMPSTLFRFIYLLILLAVIGGVSYILYRRKKYWRSAQSAIDYKIKSGDTLTSVSKQFDMSWKTLVRLNKLKKPYTLEIGDTIKILPGPNHLLATVSTDIPPSEPKKTKSKSKATKKTDKPSE